MSGYRSACKGTDPQTWKIRLFNILRWDRSDG